MESCEVVINGVHKSCDLIQILLIAGAAVTNRGNNWKAAERETSVYLPFMQSVPMLPQNVHKIGEWEKWCMLEGMDPKKTVEQLLFQCWEPARRWCVIWRKSVATEGCQLEQSGHKPSCTALCRSEAFSLSS